MRKISTLLSTILFLSLSLSASAFEADFSAKIRDVNTEEDDARIISTANFENTDIQIDGSFTVAYSVTSSRDQIFVGSATIDANETEVIVGNTRNGRIKITHEIETGIIKTRFVKKVIHDSGITGNSSTNYTVVATSGDWNGESTITSTFAPEIGFPDQITIGGVATYTGPQFFLNWVEVTIGGDLVFSGNIQGEGAFSLNVDTGLNADSPIDPLDIQVDVYANWDGGQLKGTATSLLLPRETSYDLGLIQLSAIPE